MNFGDLLGGMGQKQQGQMDPMSMLFGMVGQNPQMLMGILPQLLAGKGGMGNMLGQLGGLFK